jgi:hypothetical protein
MERMVVGKTLHLRKGKTIRKKPLSCDKLRANGK